MNINNGLPLMSLQFLCQTDPEPSSDSIDESFDWPSTDSITIKTEPQHKEVPFFHFVVEQPQVPSTHSRKLFRDLIGQQFSADLHAQELSYEEIIQKYRTLYPAYASKFTANFCSKVRCGRIMKWSSSNRSEGERMKRPKKVSTRKTWAKMTPDLFEQIYAWEQKQKGVVKHSDIELVWNVNRSTYYRWKKSHQENQQHS
eukprot:TRINITY_DN4226_c0_g2_i2.p1 TRINITY_DN4226_c0_g2~~TRINITY_DN4226_c0_g2_i2.p1  ORF type:complete len:200 (-),score=34.98 TRINITY_DN4226_c0_g2_i2:67-666(-)